MGWSDWRKLDHNAHVVARGAAGGRLARRAQREPELSGLRRPICSRPMRRPAFGRRDGTQVGLDPTPLRQARSRFVWFMTLVEQLHSFASSRSSLSQPIGIGSTSGVRARVSARCPRRRSHRTDVTQPFLGALQVSFELSQARARSHAPPVELRAQQRHPVMAIAHVGLRHLDFAGRAHESNSNITRIAADPRDRNVVTSGLESATASVAG